MSTPPPLDYRSPAATPPPVPPTPAIPLAQPATPASPSPEQLAYLARAPGLFRPLRRAISYARFESITLLLFGILTVATGYSSASSLFIGLALTACGAFEYHSAALLRSLDRRAPKRLALNQCFLAVTLIIYAAWQLILLHRNPHALSTELSQAGASGMDLSDIEDLSNTILSLLYYSLFIIAFVGCGLTALFYLSRRKHLETYLAEIPPWARPH